MGFRHEKAKRSIMTELSISSRTSDVSTIEDSIDAVFRSNPEYSEVLDDDGWTIEYDKDSTEVLITVRHGGVVLEDAMSDFASLGEVKIKEGDRILSDEELEEATENVAEEDDAPAAAWTEEYLNYLGMSMSDFA